MPAGPPGDPGLTITWQTNDAESVTFEPAGYFNPNSGWWSYTGFAIDPGTGVTINYYLNANVAVEEVPLFATSAGTLVTGNVTIENPSLQTVVQRVTITVPSTEMQAGAVAGASAAIGLTTDQGGGSIKALPDGAVWTGLVDGGGAFAAFPYPFVLGSNCGIIGCPNSYTLFFPEPAPPVTASVGIKLEFELTQLDQASITSVFIVATLLGDLDGDRTVGIVDFLALLAAWGTCSDCGKCPADLDGDCSVGDLDLLVLLGNWG